MLLGKRPRPPIKRTTSMKEFSLDLSTITIDGVSGPHGAVNKSQPFDPNNPFKGLDQRFIAAASVPSSSPPPPPPPPSQPRNLRRNSADFINTDKPADHFLKACSLCKRPLIPARDIYMYRGDSAFCSLECRQQQMNQDERKEKCSSVASKKDIATTIATGSEVSVKSETVAAV
ncbi:hypothetical protein ACH5RR_026795 [Cinchona calisaya]|uniref:FLZ-type domain-containing protein n=1 Tax=Cinchona calisaya TaxID=153742 RepID=A0ABD2Z3L8_9GENT